MESSRHPSPQYNNPFSPQNVSKRDQQVSFYENYGKNEDEISDYTTNGAQKLSNTNYGLLSNPLTDSRKGSHGIYGCSGETPKRDALIKPLYNPSWEFERSDTLSRAKAYGICHVPLSTTIIINIILICSITAIVCIIPLQTMSTSVVERLSRTLSTSLAGSIGESVAQSILTLPTVLQTIAAQMMQNSTTQSWEWTENSMPQIMEYLCHIAFLQASTLNLLYLSVSSPDGGYSAFCGGQYDEYTLVGNYITDGKSSPRYEINLSTYSLTTPEVVYTAVKSMTPTEYTVDFGAPNNAWHQIALPVFNGSSKATGGDYFIFRDRGRAVVTYAIPLVDSNKNRFLVSGALQPSGIRKTVTSNEIASVFGDAVLFEPETGVVFDYSLADAPKTRMDNWNWDSPNISSQVPPLLYIDNITHPLLQEALASFRKAAMSLRGAKWATQFPFDGTTATAIANTLHSNDPEHALLVLLYVNASSYAQGVNFIKTTIFVVIVVILFVIGVADVFLVSRFLQPLHGLQDPDVHSEAQDKAFSNISEIATMQRHFMNLNLQLLRMKSFLPHSVLGLPPTQGENKLAIDDEKNEYSDIMGSVGFQPGGEALDLHLNERALTDQVNHYRRKYCTLALFCLHITDTETSSSLLGTLSGAFLEAVIPTVVQFGGVIEIQRPDALVTTFGAQRYMAMHQQRAVQCALQVEQSVNANSLISCRFVSFIDVEDCFVGTCGAAERYARVTYKNAMPTRPEVIKLCKVLSCKTLITQRLAVTLDDNFLLMPVDTIKLPQTREPILLYELRGDVRQLSERSEVDLLRSVISTARNVFERLSRADYSGALQLLEVGEKRDLQLARLLDVCRKHIYQNDRRAYFRVLDQIHYETPSYINAVDLRRSSSTQPAAANTTNQLPDFDVSCFAFPYSSRIIEGCNPYGEEEGNEGDDFGALFDVVIEDAEEEEALQSAVFTKSSHLSNTVNTGKFECVVAGEIPIKFVDLGGTEWTRSSDTLGSGAYADVYRGLSSTGTLAALKCIQLRSKNVALSSISEEIRLFSCLDHENIVQYLSVFVSDSYLIQIMEFVPGGALDCLTKNFGSLKPGSCCRFVRDILCGLSYLHSKGIVHCDIKPHNVLLAMDGQCKLSDFGSAMRRAATDGEIEDVIELRGTPGYMAPEVAKGGLPTPKSDIFSLGVTILELLLGKLPWAYVTPKEENEQTRKSLSTSSNKDDQHPKNPAIMGSDIQNPSPLLTDLTELNGSPEEKDAGNPLSAKIPIERLLRNPAAFVRAISLGHIAPQIPDTLNKDVVSFIERCICHIPEERATPEELLRHRWVM